ncbi:MAG: dethiobiotin synthase [Rhizomicrobium sp.]
MAAYFVTSTGTDVGKTYVTTGLIRARMQAGQAVHGFKPLLSDFAMDRAGGSDAGRILAAMGQPVTPQTLDRITPWRFKAALSPDMAAALEGKSVDYAALVDFSRNAAAGPGLRLIEGVGGVMVPLDVGHTVLDWMADLGLPAIVVAGTYLGTISHILTAHAVLAARGLNVAALVLNDSGDGAVPHDQTLATLARFLPDVPMVLAPRRAAERDNGADFAALAHLLAG